MFGPIRLWFYVDFIELPALSNSAGAYPCFVFRGLDYTGSIAVLAVYGCPSLKI
jgi:hypothetical protein